MSKSTPIDSKQLIGSSKRKRKSSIIKRNILVDESDDFSKAEKAQGKKLKTDKTKSDSKKDKSLNLPDNIVPDANDANEDEILSNDKSEPEDKVEDDGRKPRGKTKEKNCSSSKQQCQNCSFCSEHKPEKEESEECSKSKKRYPCDQCASMGVKRIYNSLEKYKHHVSLLHEKLKEEVKRFECTDCPEPIWFPTKSKFCYHLGAKHPGIIKFICEVCTEAFKLKANYKNHMKTHNIVVQKKFSCDVCNGTFVNRAGFEAHKKRFPGPHIKQNCSHCGFSFSREKHMKNHRCKKLLLEEAARANNQNETEARPETFSQEQQTIEEIRGDQSVLSLVENTEKEISTEAEPDPLENKEEFEDNNKKIVFHRIVPRRNQDQTIYRPVQMQSQNVSESVVVQELREIDLENGTFITTGDDQQIIIRDVNGHLVPGNQILQLDLNDVQPGEESQVYLADWNVVAPFVIREKSP